MDNFGQLFEVFFGVSFFGFLENLLYFIVPSLVEVVDRLHPCI